jgi:hypothetical protein
MYHKSAIIVVLAIAFGLPELGCGPSCQKIVSTKKPEDLAHDDTVRVNGLVDRRKAAIATSEGGNQYVIEDAQQTVTACEMAIQFQMQIITLQKDGSALVEENQKKINEARCFLDDVIASKGKLIGKGKGAFISGSDARRIRSYLEEFGGLFGDEGALSERRLVDIYENGIKAKKNKAPKEEEMGEEGEGGDEGASGEAGAEKESGEGDNWGETPSEDEDEGEGDSGGSSMDSF